MAVATTTSPNTSPRSLMVRSGVIGIARLSKRRLTSWKNTCAASSSNFRYERLPHLGPVAKEV